MRRTRPQGCYQGREDDFQSSAIALVSSIVAPHGVPREAIMHIPSGAVLQGDQRQRAMQARRLKERGWRGGYPDIMVFAKEGTFALAQRNGWGNAYVGLAIELKVWPNKPTDEQVAIHAMLTSAGWKTHVCYGLDEVQAAVEQHFGKFNQTK